MKTPTILIYGYGNPGRKDDGLGVHFVEEMDKWVSERGFSNIRFDVNYQLNPEDALAIASHDIVLFVDASQENIFDFTIEKVKKSEEVDFSMHSVSPGYIVHLCNHIYGKLPTVYLLHIKGYEWQLELGLTQGASENLRQALTFVQESIEESIINNNGAVFNFQHR